MSVDKKINYVEQDGYNNYIKNSDSVTVPRKFKSREDATPTKLAYITADEAKMLKKMKKGTPHKGPSGVPSYDSFDAQGNYTSGTAMSAAETGSTNERDRAEVRASNIGGPKGLAPGVKSQEELALRAAAINAGAGQRVNPSFFDSRDTISPAELAMAKAYRKNPNNLFANQAYKNTRGGGIMNFITSGGILGNLIRGLGQRFGLGKKYNKPTYDMSEFNKLGLGGVDPTVNPDYYNDLDNELMLSTKAPSPTLDLSKLETGDLNNLASLIKASEEPKAIAPNFMYMSPQFQEGIDNSMYGGDRMLFGSDKNQVYYDGDVLPDGTVFESEADGITNYEFDEQPNEGIMSQVDDVPTDLEIFYKRFP